MSKPARDRLQGRHGEHAEEEKPRFRFEESAWVALLLYVALTAVLFWPVVVGHASLMRADMLYDRDPILGGHPPRPVITGYINEPSPYLIAAPWDAFAARSFRLAEFPLWNPHQGTGMPLLANLHSAILSPFKIPYYLHPTRWSLEMTLLLKIVVAGLGAFVLARRLGFAAGSGALLAGAAYAFSGVMMVDPSTNDGFPAAVAPWLLLAFEALARSGSARAISLTGLAAAATLLSGHPKVGANIILGATLWFILRMLTAAEPSRWTERFRRIVARLAAAGALGAATSAAALIPFAEYIRNGWVYTADTSSKTVGERWLVMTNGLIQHFSGTDDLNGFAYCVYVGLPVLALAVVGLWALSWRQRAAPLMLLVLSVGIVLDIPPVSLLHQLPPLSLSQPKYFLALLALPAAILAAAGLASLHALPSKTRLVRALWAAGGLATVTLICLWIDFKGHLQPALSHALPQAGLSWILVIVVLGCAILPGSSASRRRLGAVAALAAAAELLASAAPVNRPKAIVPEGPPPAMMFLAARPERIRIFGQAHSAPQVTTKPKMALWCWPNRATLYGIDDIRALDAMYPRNLARYLLRLAKTHPDTPREPINLAIHMSMDADDPLLPRLAVGAVLGPPDMPGGETIYRDQTVRVRSIPGALPRAWAIHRVEIVGDPEALVDRLAEPSFPFHTTALVSEALPTTLEIREPVPGGMIETVSVESYAPRRVALRARLLEPGLVVLGDTDFPGWDATVDGRPAISITVNGLFRAVPAPAGDHVVVWRYRPLSWTIGCGLSVLGLMIAAGLLLRRGR